MVNQKQLLLIFFIIYQHTTSGTTVSTTEATTPSPYMECPEDFELYNNTCYVLNNTCPFLNPLPFGATVEIQQHLTIEYNLSIYLLNVFKDTNYDYYRWEEMRGNYGKLFTNRLNSSDEEYYDQVAVDYDNNKTRYITTNQSIDYNYTCAYSTTDNFDNTYCGLYNKICTNHTDSRDTTNCHCRNNTLSHFCEAYCDCDGNDTTCFNETVCSECEIILKAYHQPSIHLFFNYIRWFILVQVSSYLKLLTVVEEYPVYCFTDANHSLHDVTYRYDFEEDVFVSYNDTFKNVYYKILPLNRSIGHYWCEGFDFNGSSISSETIIARVENINESLTMNITRDNVTEEYPLQLHEDLAEYISDKTSGLVEEVRFLHLYPKNTTTNSYIIAYRLYLEREHNISYALDEIPKLFDETYNITLSPSYCLPETTIVNNITLTWDKTLLGVTTISQELCLTSERNPVTRTCLGEYLYGTYWSAVEGSCERDSGEKYGSTRTVPLHNLTHSSEDPGSKFEKLRNLMEGLEEPISVDAHFVAQIIENVTVSGMNYSLQDLIEAASSAMDLNRGVLRKAQATLNTTDKILYSVDLALNSKYGEIDNRTFFHVKTKNIYVQASRISLNYSGAAFYDAGDDGLEIRPLHQEKVETFETEDLQLAIYITETEMMQVKDLGLSNESLIIVLFRNDALFNQRYKENATTGYLASLYVSGFEDPFLYDSVRVITKPSRRYRAKLQCNCWRYGVDGLWYNTYGEWKGFWPPPSVFQEKFQSCHYWSMSHYSILVGDEGNIALSIITVIGCVLSTLGGVGVFVTAIIYKTWREKSGTKILLNFVTTVLFQNVVLSVSTSVDSFKDVKGCVFVGALLHYCVDSQFSWMVVIGYLQYQRYVKVFFHVGTRFVVYAAVAAWGLPLIPVATILLLDSKYYVQEKYCYLTDNPLFFAVFLPITLVLTLNFAIFALILKNVCRKNSQAPKDSISILQLRLVILLFFLLGFYWVLGIGARFIQSIALDYFFCIFAALQGSVVFLYYIVFNRMTRNFWIRQLRRSEMISSMQIWLQQKKKVGDVKLDRSETKKTKMMIDKVLRKKK